MVRRSLAFYAYSGYICFGTSELYQIIRQGCPSKVEHAAPTASENNARLLNTWVGDASVVDLFLCLSSDRTSAASRTHSRQDFFTGALGTICHLLLCYDRTPYCVSLGEGESLVIGSDLRAFSNLHPRDRKIFTILPPRTLDRVIRIFGCRKRGAGIDFEHMYYSSYILLYRV